MTAITTRALGHLVGQLDGLLEGLVPPSAGGVVVPAWHPQGLPLELDAFGGDPAAAGEALDALTDATGQVVGGWLQATPLAASHLYERICHGDPGRRAPGEEGERGAARPVVATPANWWDASARGNWTPFAVSSAFTSAGYPARSRPHPRPADGWAWRVLPRSLRWLAAAGLDGAPPVGAPGSLTSAGTAAARGALVLRAHQVARLATVAGPAPIGASQLRVSFDYCSVSLSRRWWDGGLLARRGWHVPARPAHGQPAAAPPPVGVPVGLVLVRNLRLAGEWTDADRANLAGASAFGPFSLLGRAVDSHGTVSVRGVQLVGWILHLLPAAPCRLRAAGALAGAVTPAGRPPGG